MTQKNANNVKLAVSALTLCLVAPNTLLSEAQAGMITGVAPEYVNGNKVYNIDPTVLNGDTGFRIYEYFKLNKDEIANLIFKYGEHNISKFINLVDNQIDINGLVNSVNADGSFNNGHVMFVSPNGMVVGASGVLNLGSLTVLTPEYNNYKKFTSDFDIKGPLAADMTNLYSKGTGTVTIDGKVITRDFVDINAAAVNINNSIMSGVKNSDLITTNAQADILFNNLVNTDNMKAGNTFASDSGSIKITSYSAKEGVNIAEGSTLKNFGKGDIEVTSHGEKGILANGDIKNPNGNVRLTTTNGTIYANGKIVNANGNTELTSTNGILLASSGSINNSNGNTTLKNKGTIGIDVKGTIENSGGDLTLDNTATDGILVDNNVLNSNGDVIINNTGAKGIVVISQIKNNVGNLSMTNSGEAGIVINGDVINYDGNSTYLNEAGEFTVNGNIKNSNGLLKVTNNGTGIKIASTGSVVNEKSGDLEMTNTGEAGILVDGIVSNENGNSTYLNEAGEFTVNGNIKNSNGLLKVTNNGTGIKIASTGSVINEKSGDLEMTNTGEAGILVDGIVSNENGNSTYLNEAGEFTVNGNIKNSNGLLKVTNNGTGIKIASTGSVVNEKSGDLEMTNTGEAGILVDGIISNENGNSTYLNEAGEFTVNGNIKNSNGLLKVTNNGTGIKIASTGSVVNEKSGDLEMTNTGEAGILVDGIVSNENGNSTYLNEAGEFTVNGNVKNSNGLLKVTNNGTGIKIASTGSVVNEKSGDLEMTNTGEAGILVDGIISNENGNSTYLNKDGSIVVNGEIYNNGDLTMTNEYSGIDAGFEISGKVTNDKGVATLVNNGGANFHVKESGVVTGNGKALNIKNPISGIKIDGVVNSNSESMLIENTGHGGIEINGTVNNFTGDAIIKNESGDQHGDAILIGEGIKINKTGKVYSGKDTTLLIDNGKYSSGLDFNGILVDGEIISDGKSLDIKNESYDIDINGQINNNNGVATISNTDRFGGIKLSSVGQINSKGTELKLYNSGSAGTLVEGKITHDNNAGKVEIINKNSNVVIGHNTTESNITSNGDVLIDVEKGNIYNYGVANRLIHITDGADLTMTTNGGEIGRDDGNCGEACIGIGPVSRDFTKSINVTSDGKITAIANQGNLKKDVVVNIAGFNSDLNIDQVKADGKVILTTADFDKDGKGYSILNASTDSTKANVEGKGFALIASDKIGEAENKLTFNQTAGKFNKEGLDIENLSYNPTAEYGVEMLAINDINVKGHDDKYDTHVCTMISREGTIDAEFSGDTYIREITADKGLKVVTRGAELVIDNLGKVPNTPEDYFGPNGDISPEEVVVKALDINPNTRVDMEEIDGVKHWANSHVIIRDGVVDDMARVNIVGDDVYAGGYHFHMGKDRNPEGKAYYEVDDRTAMETTLGEAPRIRVEAVRPGDVIAIGRDKDERNYYTGGSVQEDEPWYDDDDDDDQPNPPVGDDDDDDDDDNFPPIKPDEIFPGDDDDDDDDHITVPEPDPSGDDDDDDDQPNPPIGDDDDDDQPNPPIGDDDDDDQPKPPAGDDDDDDDDQPKPPAGDDDDDDDDDDRFDIPSHLKDGRMTWKREIGDSISVIDKRQYMRFSLDRSNVPVSFAANDKISNVLDISRGGIAVSHNNTLKVGDVVPVRLSYGDVEIDTNVKIVTASDVRAGAEFVDLDSTTANRILYLNLLLEEDYKLSQGLGAQI